MRDTFKKILSAVSCYLLFLAVQLLVSFAMQFIYGVKLGIELAAKGEMLDEQHITTGLMEFLVQNTNMMLFISGVLTLSIFWLLFKIRKTKLREKACINKVDKKKILPLIVFGIALSFFVSSVMELFPIPESIMKSYMESAAGVASGSLLLRALSTVIVAPIVEEVVFRGVMLSKLKEGMKPWKAIVISSLLFGLAHGQILWITYAFLLGILFSIIAERTNSIVASIIVHIAFNSISLFGESICLTNMQMIVVGIISMLVGIGMLVCILKKDMKQLDMQ